MISIHAIAKTDDKNMANGMRDTSKTPLSSEEMEFVKKEIYQKKELKLGEKPEAEFAVTEPVIAAYEHCNLHGLWMAKAR